MLAESVAKEGCQGGVGGASCVCVCRPDTVHLCLLSIQALL